jgi:hypothetical protein
MAELSMAEAAAKTRQWTGQELAEVSLRQAAQRGALKAHKKGKDWYTTDAELRKYLKSRPQHFKEGQRTDTVSSGTRKVHMVAHRSHKKVTLKE